MNLQTQHHFLNRRVIFSDLHSFWGPQHLSLNLMQIGLTFLKYTFELLIIITKVICQEKEENFIFRNVLNESYLQNNLISSLTAIISQI